MASGVVFSDRALDFLRDDDEETYRLITPAMQEWTDLVLFHRGERVVIDGVGFAAIGRLELLKLLRRRLASVGIVPEYGHIVTDEAEMSACDLVVGADGVHSFGTAPVRGGVRHARRLAVQPLRLVRHDARLRDVEPDVCRHAVRADERSPLPLCAGDEHIHRRMRRCHVATRRL